MRCAPRTTRHGSTCSSLALLNQDVFTAQDASAVHGWNGQRRSRVKLWRWRGARRTCRICCERQRTLEFGRVLFMSISVGSSSFACCCAVWYTRLASLSHIYIYIYIYIYTPVTAALRLIGSLYIDIYGYIYIYIYICIYAYCSLSLLDA